MISGVSHLAPLAAKLAFAEFKAARMAKKGEREAERRAAEKIAPIVAEARLSGIEAALNVLGFHGHEQARIAIGRLIEAERDAH